MHLWFHLPRLKIYVGKERTVLRLMLLKGCHCVDIIRKIIFFVVTFLIITLCSGNQNKPTDVLCCRRTRRWTQRDFTLSGRLWWIIVASASSLRRSFLDYWRKTRRKVSSMALMTTGKLFSHTPGNKQTKSNLSI